MEDLDKLIKKRGLLKKRVTLLTKYLNKIQTNHEDIGNIPKVVLNELKSRLEKHELLYQEFNEIQSDIELLHVNFDDQTSEREQFEDAYYNALSVGKDIIDKNSTDSNSNSTENYASVAQARTETDAQIRLPQIRLPTFDGSFDKWLEFKNTFETLIHNNKSLNNTQRFHYLRSATTGAAGNVVNSVQFADYNYGTAWKLLCNRYLKKRLLLKNHFRTLLSVPSLQRENSVSLHELVDSLLKHEQALSALELPKKDWGEQLLIYLLSEKLDKTSRRDWEEYKTKEDFPTLNEFKAFATERADLLENIKSDCEQSKRAVPIKPTTQRTFMTAHQIKCVICNKEHYITNCSQFLALSPLDRFNKAKQLKLCLNCLKSGHIGKNCKSGNCRKCNAKHNSLLHQERSVTESNSNKSPSVEKDVTTESKCTADSKNVNVTCNFSQNEGVLLPTALIQIYDSQGCPCVCRALLDSGSQSNFLTMELCEKLNLEKVDTSISVIGIHQTISEIKHKCSAQISSCSQNFNKTLNFLIVPHISNQLLPYKIDVTNLNIPPHIRLADPEFNAPRRIDMLLGAEVLFNIMCIGQINLGNGLPTLQKTQFGWVVAGPVSTLQLNRNINCNFSKVDEIRQQLTKFWEVEDHCNSKPVLTDDEKECETIFVNTTRREIDGRFVVKIPFKQSPSMLGDSSQTAHKRFLLLERKLQRNPELKEMYIAFMREYEVLGHMSCVTHVTLNQSEYYLPHHGVFREDSSSTKLRVVFDGSAKSSSGYSLNDIQLVGPTIQSDLISILLRFRQHKFVVCSDIAKMYRMIMVDPTQRSLQKIYWRENPDQLLRVYNLNTVTYGTASAPFLAVRCLHQLAMEYQNIYPQAATVISKDFYVDDMLTGGDNTAEIIKLCSEVIKILKSGGFELRKWLSNSKIVLDSIEESEPCPENLRFGDPSKSKTLGLYWSAKTDSLMYSISPISERAKVTKRSILSHIGQIFDPLGLLSPSIIIAKILLQRLWELNISWDESLPVELHSSWSDFRSQLISINELEISRRVIIDTPVRFELHGFSDASQRAYGACIYIRSVADNGQASMSLLYAKSRVAPIKVLTIPRLELCAAQLLAQLVNKVKSSLNIEFNTTVLWTDSSVVLSWIGTSSRSLQVFESHRVSQIQSLTNPHDWRHIKSEDNPADALSRGVFPNDLKDLSLWWNGPHWLVLDSDQWPESRPELLKEPPGLKKTINVFPAATAQNDFPFTRFSQLLRLVNAVSYCFRFCEKCRNKNSYESTSISPQEYDKTLKVLLRLVQRETYPDEIAAIKNRVSKPTVKFNSKLLSLDPFVDHQGLLRVGGRLQMSPFSYDKKHPIIIPANHKLTRLIFEAEHKRLLHGGPQLLLSSIRDKYWPIGGRTLAKRVVRSCIICSRMHPGKINPKMGMLPQQRVTPAAPFATTGIDYAGPFLIKEKKGRGAKHTKGYVCLFVCFTTTAIHLELVSDLSTEAFLAALRRFISRRGRPSNIWSDNGRNFIGANSELKELYAFLSNSNHAIESSLLSDQIKWNFIPAYSAHFGGLWEAGVKSAKYHMKRVMQGAFLTVEEFYTMLTQIEAILNSRPLTPLSPDPKDLEVLTPAHFLVGRKLTSLPETDLTNLPENRLSRFERVQQIQQNFWVRWAKEYVTELQTRSKWKESQGALKIGSIVLVREANQPPCNWSLGRIIRVHTGKDGINRVATLKTKGGEIKRSFSMICPLPIEEKDSHSEV